jgi:hypothetical protein
VNGPADCNSHNEDDYCHQWDKKVTGERRRRYVNEPPHFLLPSLTQYNGDKQRRHSDDPIKSPRPGRWLPRLTVSKLAP